MKRMIWLHLIVVLMVVFVSTCVSLAQSYNPLPDTGQSLCYDVAGNVITCPAEGQPLHGQDAQYQEVAPAYQDNDDGTVTDLNTGLMWMQVTADTNNDGVIDDNDKLIWQDAINYCAALSFAGYADWRLPEKFDLQSIVDYGRNHPALHPVFMPESSGYWSSTACADNSTGAWGLWMYHGNNSCIAMDYAQQARCVRGGL